MKLLSIIIPTYNMERYLDKCLSSLIVDDAEILKQLEVLVIIDGATDHSSEIAHSYEACYPGVFVVIDKENGNYGSCINRGLQLATGRYVKVLDADDSFDTANFGNYLRFLNGVDVDMIITPCLFVDEAGNEKQHVAYDLPEKEIITWQQLTPAFKKKSLLMHVVTYKLQNIKDIHYKQTEGISYTDQEWIFTPLTAVNKAIAYPHTIYKYLIGREGQTVNPEIFKRNLSHNEQCCRRIIRDYKSFGKFEPAKQEYIDYRFELTITAMYYWYLVQYPDMDIQQLVQYDDYVRSVDASYVKLLDAQCLRFTRYRYISQWHENRHERISICRLYRFYSRIMSKICNMYAR